MNRLSFPIRTDFFILPGMDTTDSSRTFGFMGAGRIVEILLDSLGPAVGEGRGLIWNRSRPRAERLAERHGLLVRETPEDLARNADRVLLAVKPKAVASVLTQAAPGMSPDTLLVSMAAGVSIARLRSFFATPPRIIRIMPNIALSVGLGMTAVCADENVPPEEVEEILGIFRRAGRARLVEEDWLDTVTALSGSGPAFVFLFIESLADGAVLNGMSREAAYEFAAQTLMGASRIILESGMHPGELKDIVASPAGTTIAGIHVMERRAFRSIVMDAVDAAARRSREISA